MEKRRGGGAYKSLEGRGRDGHVGGSCGRFFGGAGLFLLW